MSKRIKRVKEQPDLATTLQALKETDDEHVSATVFYGLSGLSAEDAAQVQPVWESMQPEHRRKIMRRLVDVGESNVEMDYRTIGVMSLEDSDAGVREAAIDLLFEDMSVEVMNRLIDMAQWDDVPEVRAAAISALGRFILAGELEEFPESESVRAQDVAVALWSNESEELDVRRRALEAISNCGHEMVTEAIEEAYHSDEHKMRVSALFAMGRSCDERWTPLVLRELQSPDAELRYEAAKAAGELSARDAVPALVKLAFENDREIKEVAVWALGEIGGTDATRALNKLARDAEAADDDELMEAIEDALANAQLADMLELDDDELNDDWRW